jgi:hypothetical protein
MGTILETVRRYMASEDWGYDFHPEHNGLEAGVRTEEGTFTFRFVADEANRRLLFALFVLPGVPRDRRAAVAEHLMRMNWDGGTGHLVMNPDTGEVQYRSAIDVEDGTLSETMVENILDDAVASTDRAYPRLLGLALGDIDPDRTGELPTTDRERLSLPN